MLIGDCHPGCRCRQHTSPDTGSVGAETEQAVGRLRRTLASCVLWLAETVQAHGLDADHVTDHSVSIHQPGTSGHLAATIYIAVDANGYLCWHWSSGTVIGHASDIDGVVREVAKAVRVPNAPRSGATGVSWAQRTRDQPPHT